MADYLLAVTLLAARNGRQGGKAQARAARLNRKTGGHPRQVGRGAPSRRAGVVAPVSWQMGVDIN